MQGYYNVPGYSDYDSTLDPCLVALVALGAHFRTMCLNYPENVHHCPRTLGGIYTSLGNWCFSAQIAPRYIETPTDKLLCKVCVHAPRACRASWPSVQFVGVATPPPHASDAAQSTSQWATRSASHYKTALPARSHARSASRRRCASTETHQRQAIDRECRATGLI